MPLLVTLEQSHPQGPLHAQVGMVAISAVVAEGEDTDTPDTPEGEGLTMNLGSVLAPLGINPADILDILPKQTAGGQLPVVTPTEIRGQYKIKMSGSRSKSNGAAGEDAVKLWVFYHPNSPTTT